MIDKIILKENLINNVKVFRKILKNKKLCAVVKANAYGHSLDIVVNIIKKYVDFFAVATTNEALKLRNLTDKNIFILGQIDKEDICDCINNNISFSVSSSQFLNLVSKKAKQVKKNAYVHLKINSGMNRLGFNNIRSFEKCYQRYKSDNNIVIEGIFSHIHNQNDNELIDKQKRIFDKFIEKIDDENTIKHLACTNVALNREDCLYDMARIGIGLYNFNENNSFGLKPVMEIKTKIINIIKVKKGDNVGYESGFIANKNMKVAVVSIGYADGYLRRFGNKAQMLVHGKRCNVIGNICMDMCFIDVTNIDCKTFDEIVVIGKQENENINAKELAEIGSTIDYEILTNFKNDRMNLLVK